MPPATSVLSTNSLTLQTQQPHRHSERPVFGGEGKERLDDSVVYLHRSGNCARGMYERDAKEKGIEVETYVRPLKDVDRAIADGRKKGS